MPPVSPASKALEEYSRMSNALVWLLLLAIIADAVMLLSAVSPSLLKAITVLAVFAAAFGGCGYGLYLLA